MNNQPPLLATRSPPTQVRLSEHEGSNPFKYWQQTLAEKQAEQEQQSAKGSLGQFPKRTVSLGSRRILQQSPFLKGQAERERDFNKAAEDLQSSLTELNQLINSPPTPEKATNKPPRLALREVPIVVGDQSDSPEARPPRWQWQEDLSNWKSSSSVIDLRSAFEQSKLTASPTISSNNNKNNSAQRPPRSASPSVLRKSPWAAIDSDAANAFPPQPPLASASLSLRRTTSSSSSTRPILRNPYRSQY